MSFLRDHVFAWHPHVGELHDSVVERAQAHETTAVCDLEPGRIDIDDKCSDLLPLLAVHNFWRRFCHHHQNAGLDQICAPKLFAIQDETGAVFAFVGAQTHVRGIGPGIPFGQRESRDFLARDPRQIFVLLLFGSEQEQRLRNTERLMRGNERSQVRVPASEQHRGATVIDLRQTEALVLLRNFYPKCAHHEKFLDVFLRNLACAIDLIGIDVISQIIL